MADGTQIEWADATLNYVNGCSVHTPGCTNCYAMKLAGTRLKQHPSRAGLTQHTKAGPVWTGEVRAHEPALLQALKWKRPRRIFWNAHGDLFHENVPDEWIDRLFAVCALTPQHTHMILTKRSARMREYMLSPSRKGTIAAQSLWVSDELARRAGSHKARIPLDHFSRCFAGHGPFPNVWLGVSVEDQQRADERIPDLLATPAAVRFISAEPLLGPVDLTSHIHDSTCGLVDPDWPTAVYERTCTCSEPREVSLDWVIVGGESGPNARPMHPDWARELRDQCAAAGVAFHFKQWGEWGPDVGPDDDFDKQGYRRDRVMEGAGPCAAWRNGAWEFAVDGYAMPLVEGADTQWVYRLGKKRNGRLLDDVEHNGFPA